MTIYEGNDISLWIGDNADALLASYAPLNGIRVQSFTVTADRIDASALGSGVWQVQPDVAGHLRLTIRAEGLYTGDIAEVTLQEYSFAGQAFPLRMRFGNGELADVTMRVVRYERQSAHHQAEQLQVTLESAGAISYN